MKTRHMYFSSKLQTRELSDNQEPTIEGYFAVFNQETELYPGCFESIAQGAFDTSLKNNDIRCLFNHRTDLVLGREQAGTLKLTTDDYGLYGVVNINQNDDEAMQARKTHHRMLVSAEKVQLGYDYPLFQPLSFEIEQGQRFALRGANGSGKTTILAAILGTFSGNLQGNLTIPKGITISTVRQNYEDNRGTLAEFAEENGLVYADLLNNLFKLGVERTVFHTRIEQMSMGQRKRVELAKSLATPAELFIWDEPLNYLDVFNHQQIEQVIQMIQPTMIVVEHDARFIDTIATNVLDVIPVNAFKESER